MLLRFVLVGVVLVGCSKRNDTVCCLTAADCESIGLSANDVGNRGCRDGESCVDLTCVPTPPADAATPDARADGAPAPDAPYSGRCDASKAFATLTDLPNVHVGYGEQHFILSSDELTAYIVRDNQSVIEVSSSVRASKTDDFPVDTTDPLLMIASHAFELFPARQQHLLYFRTRVTPMYHLAQRNNLTDAFVETSGIGIDDVGDPLPSGAQFAGVSDDATKLYYTAGGYLYQLSSSSSYSDFGVPLKITSMNVDAVALSPNQLTLYYSTNPASGVYVSKRADTDSVFGDGTLISILANDDRPASVTADDCILYIIGAHNSVSGVYAVTKPH